MLCEKNIHKKGKVYKKYTEKNCTQKINNAKTSKKRLGTLIAIVYKYECNNNAKQASKDITSSLGVVIAFSPCLFFF